MSDEEKRLAVANEEPSLPPEVEQIIDNIPEEKRDEVRQMVEITMSMMTRTSPEAEMVKRMTPENFSQILKNEAEETELAYKDKGDARKTALIVVALVIAFLVVAMVILKDKPELLKEIVIPLLTFVAGALSGYGFGSRKKSDD